MCYVENKTSKSLRKERSVTRHYSFVYCQQRVVLRWSQKCSNCNLYSGFASPRFVQLCRIVVPHLDPRNEVAVLLHHAQWLYQQNEQNLLADDVQLRYPRKSKQHGGQAVISVIWFSKLLHSTLGCRQRYNILFEGFYCIRLAKELKKQYKTFFYHWEKIIAILSEINFRRAWKAKLNPWNLPMSSCADRIDARILCFFLIL